MLPFAIPGYAVVLEYVMLPHGSDFSTTLMGLTLSAKRQVRLSVFGDPLYLYVLVEQAV